MIGELQQLQGLDGNASKLQTLEKIVTSLSLENKQLKESLTKAEADSGKWEDRYHKLLIGDAVPSSNSSGSLGSILYLCFVLLVIIWGVGVFTGQGLNPIESFPKIYTTVTENEKIFGEKSE